MRSGYKMKGMDFGNSPVKQTKFPAHEKQAKKRKNDAKLAKANAEYEKGLAERVSVNNPEHAKGAEGRLVALNNDHDVDDNGVPQIGAAEYYKKTGKKPKK